MANIEKEIEKLAKDKVESLEGPPVVAAIKEPTKEQILETVTLLQRKENNGGYRPIAETVGIKPSQVKRIHKAMKARLGELVAAEEVES